MEQSEKIINSFEDRKKLALTNSQKKSKLIHFTLEERDSIEKKAASVGLDSKNYLENLALVDANEKPYPADEIEFLTIFKIKTACLALRKQNKWSIRDLADKSGVSKSSIGRVEKGSAIDLTNGTELYKYCIDKLI